MGENPDHALAFDDVHAPHHAVLLPGQVDGAHVGSGDAGMVGYVREEQEDGAEEPREGLMAVEGIEGDFAGDGGGAGIVVAPGIGSQLTLSFQGEVYVFDAVTPEKVQSVLLLLGGRELTSGVVGSPPPSSYQYNGRLNLPQRVASLMRFREKRKERNFGKKIRYDVRKEVALRMQRHRGQFAPSNQKSDVAGVDATNWDTPQNWGSVEMPLVQSASECHHCGVSAESTPMMRRGPDGPRTLCNACGLMWATKGALKDLSRSSTSADPSKKVLTSHEPDSLIKCGETAATDESNPNLRANGHGHPL